MYHHLKDSYINTNINIFNLKPDKKITTPLKDKISIILNNEKKRIKLKSNLLRGSYNNRLLRSKKRKLYFKTIKQQHRLRRHIEEIEKTFSKYVKKNIPKIEKREKNKQIFTGKFLNLIPMAFRNYCHTKVYVTHCNKNTFLTVFKGMKAQRRNEFKLKVFYKSSCGLIGYTGPKKPTVFARKEVIKEVGSLLGSYMTTLMSVVFTSKVSRWNRKSVRNLCNNLAYVLTIAINYTRSHGFIKHKNRRRK
jgi:hypothetical protein